ncbi:MAG: hypothetical protein JO214_10950 [Frankiaceae bacterium]|nr:hypothetical protein [Frankiaceae bacterium]
MSSEEPARRIRGPRRATVGLSLMGLSIIGLSVGPSLAAGATAAPQRQHAAAAVGSDIGALDVTATSTGITMPLYSHSGEDVALNIPYAMASLGTGGIGNALTSIFWPGGTGAHGGDTVNLLGLPIPANVGSMLNDPEVAHAQTGVGDKTVDNSRPGVVMTSSATPLHVSAESAAGGKNVPLFGPVVGSTSSKSTINVTGSSTVTTDAISSAHDISVEKVITIDSVTSTAHAVSDGRNVAKGKAKTVVSGVKIAGVAVTVDQNGVHVPNKNLPIVGSSATKVVNTALKSSGLSLEVTKITHKVHGQHIELDSGALVIGFDNVQYTSQGNDSGKLLFIGGAKVNQTVHHGFKPPPPPKSPTPTPTHSGGGGGGGGGSSNIPSTGGGNIPPVQNPPTGPGSSLGPDPTIAGPQLPAANSLSLPKGLQVGWIIAALIGAGLFAIGMRRLPDQVLQPAGTTCSLEE